MAVNLTRIYTRTGDDGTTALGDMSRTAKTSTRLTAYADVDEANAALGLALAHGGLPDDLARFLAAVQNDLFDVGADLCTPVTPDPEYPPLRVEDGDVERLERACDRWNADLEKLRSFVMPTGTVTAAALHLARTTTRRAERAVWALLAEEPDVTNPVPARYLNRLSDLLFIASRVANDHGGSGDVTWVPAGNRHDD